MFGALIIHWNADPILIHIGMGGLRWYSLLFVGGFILGWYIFKWFCKREKISLSMLDPLLYTLLIATIVGARLGHCIFYQPDYYFGSWEGFLEVFMPWKGGLASHGGAIALLLAMWWFSHHYKKTYDIDFLWIMDHLCIAVAFAGGLIRLGNLFNSEIYGDVTSLPWGFVFDLQGETEPKHPTQLYEAISYFVLGIFMLCLYDRKFDRVYRGMFFAIFLICCFGMRFLIEFIKEPQVGFEKDMLLNMGQILSIPFFFAGIVLVMVSYRNKVPAPAIHPVPTKTKQEPTHYAKSLN